MRLGPGSIAAALMGVALGACAPDGGSNPAAADAGPLLDAGTADDAGTTADAGPLVPNAMVPAHLPAFFDCLRTRGFAVVQAHRCGNEPGFAENALETMEHTLATAPAAMEIDIAQTSDGALVLMHDDTVDRTTTGTGAVADMTLAEVQALNLKDNDGLVLDAHPPTLQAALEWSAGRAFLFLDLKAGVPLAAVVDAVRVAQAENRVVVITYTRSQALAVFALAPELMISVTVSSLADLNALLTRGLDATRLIAWTGMAEPRATLNQTLADNTVEAMFGTLGDVDSWDMKFAADGMDQYAAFAATGLQLLATDRYAAAVRDLDAHDDVDGHGFQQCLQAR